jgi:hypothetical protein
MKKIMVIALTAVATWYVTPIIDRAIPHCPGYMFMIGSQPYGLSISCWGLHWYTPDEPNGFWSTEIVLRPPFVHWDYLSHAWSDLLKDDRAWSNKKEDQEWKDQHQWIKDADSAKSWTFPQYPNNL